MNLQMISWGVSNSSPYSLKTMNNMNLIKYIILGKIKAVILDVKLIIQREKYDFDT